MACPLNPSVIGGIYPQIILRCSVRSTRQSDVSISGQLSAHFFSCELFRILHLRKPERCGIGSDGK